MHREQLVVELVVDDLLARVGELGTDQHGHQAGDEEPPERGDQVHLADQLVIGRGHDAHGLLAEALLASGGGAAACGVAWLQRSLAGSLPSRRRDRPVSSDEVATEHGLLGDVARRRPARGGRRRTPPG